MNKKILLAEAGLKFESFASMPFVQSRMNNFRFLRDAYERPEIETRLCIGGSDSYMHYQGTCVSIGDLVYKSNFNIARGCITSEVLERMRAEFKFITYESFMMNDELALLKNKFHDYRTSHYVRRALKSSVRTLKLLVVGTAVLPTSRFVEINSFSSIGPLWVFAWLPFARPNFKSCEVAVKFDTFNDYFQTIYKGTSPEHLFDLLSIQTTVEATREVFERLGVELCQHQGKI